MANEKNDISDIVKTCKILLLDIEGTTTSISFVKDRLFPYVDANVQEFLENDWEVDVVKEAVKALRKLALEDEEQKVEGVVTIPGEDASKEDQIEGLVKSVKWQMSLDRKIAPLKHLQGLVWRKGYDKGDIKGHIYEDVPPALELWRSVEGQKVYIFSSGSVHAQKLLFTMSSAGNIVHLIDGHFDTTLGPKQEAASYTAIAEKIGCKPEEILFLTDIDKEAEAARSAGVHVALMSREGNAPLAEAITATFPVLYSFAELAASKKRKPDAQDEQQPAKVPKTDVEANVKTLSETQSKDSPQPTTTPPKPEETENEKMEVEEEAPAKEEIVNEQAKPKEIVEKSETIVEEITDLKEVADIPVLDTKPVIIESTEKTDQKETEMMETEPADSVSAPKQNGDNDAPGPEKTQPVVITEIRDITNDTESLSEVTEIIEDLVPVVEEPPAQDMEDLQNVGEVLDKECDEILSKVQDVTNLDNIPLKPLLNPIAEETMETENVDSNDIVEGILDSEQELEMKQCSDIDVNTVQEIAEVKTVTGAENCEKQDVVDKASEKVVLEEKRSTNDVEEAKVVEEVKETEKKAADSCTKENNVEESSSTTEVKVKESSSTTEEKDKESRLAAEEKVKESSTEEKILESGVSEGKVEENVTEEQVKESAVEQKMEESSIAEEKTKENTVEQKIEESSITEEKIMESTVEQKDAGSSLPEAKTEEQKVVVDEVKTKIEEKKVESKMETDVCTAETQTAIRCTTETQTEEKSCLSTEDKSVTTENEVESKEVSAESSAEKPTEKLAKESSMEIDQTETSVDTKDSDKIATPSAVEVVEPEKDSKDTQLNGKTTNGDTEMVNQNGDSSKDDELNARLSMENGKEVVNGANGANGDSSEAEAKSENKGDEVMDVADIKVKTVAMDEPRNDPIEQPTEA